MVDRISSFGNTANLLNQAMRLQSKYADVQQQSSSGLKSQNFTGIASGTQQLLTLQTQYNTITTQISMIGDASNRVTTMQGALSNISDLFSQIQGALTQAVSGNNTNSAGSLSSAQATSWLNELTNLLNTKYGSDYMFGGNVTDTPPVNTSDPDYDPTTAPTTANFAYYQGDDTTKSVRASSTLRIGYGITAAEPAFEQAIRALSLIANQPYVQSTLEQAQGLMKNAVEWTADLTATMQTQSALLTQESNNQTAMLDYIDKGMTDLRSSDLASSAVQLSQLETQLEASYSSLTGLLKLKLTDYLR